MAKLPTADQVAQKWATGMSGAIANYKAAIDNVQVNPMQLAAAAADRWAQGVARAASNGAFQRGLGRVTIDQWKALAKGKGADRLGSGANAAQPRYREAMQTVLNTIGRVRDNLPARGSFEENLARMTAFARGMHEAKVNG